MSPNWKPPSTPGAATFAEWNGATFALVKNMPDGKWRVGVFPDGQSHHSVGAMVATEAIARKFVECWAEVNHRRIAPAKGRQIMPPEGLKPRKPKGIEDRS
ncbi:hypothetical protein [Luteibacter sp. dw_328]|uniref:hypothetical protein n=1 Tax=Luteibacter sp. dw_328 TaxID=2719796 RepID=UPI001BD31FCD|nr:hypothetical protein [Luteibacter sp. dw_328]